MEVRAPTSVTNATNSEPRQFHCYLQWKT